MAVAEQNITQSNLTEWLRTEVQTFAREHRRALQITGLVAVAGITGAAGGLLVAKGIAAGKGVTAANLALVGKGAAAKAGATSLPALLAPQTASTVGTVGATATNTIPVVGSVQQIASLLNNSATNGLALADKATALWNTLSANVLPLTAGVVGGGAAGVGVTQRRVRKVEDQLATQLAQTETLQAETAQLHHALSTTEAQLQTVQGALETRATQAPPDVSLNMPPDMPPTMPPTMPPDVQPNVPQQAQLERIRGIGRVFAQRLSEAGIYTLQDLAAQTPDTIEAIIDKTRAGAMFNPAAWIAEAEQLVRGQKPPEGPGHATQPVAKSTAKPTVHSPATDHDDDEFVPLLLERLEAIEGISPATAARLNRAGILAYADLAEQRPDDLIVTLHSESLHSESPDSGDEIAAWIDAAHALTTQEVTQTATQK